MAADMKPQMGTTPVPDPTQLTTEAVGRLEDSLKELFGARFQAMDKIIDRLQHDMDSRPAAVDAQVGRLRELVDERFKGVSENFAGRDAAVAAALAAAALSASKSEAATTKLLDGISNTITSMAKNFDDKIEAVKALGAADTKAIDGAMSDLRLRVGAIENQKKGSDSNWGAIGAIISGAVGIILIFGFVVTLLNRPTAQPSPIIIERPAQAAGSSGVNVTTP